MCSTIHPNVFNETDQLQTVIVGLPDSLGPRPTLEQAYDARSYRSIEEGNYPIEADIKDEMSQLVSTLERLGVRVLRPRLIPNYNQIFARDVTFVIDNLLFIANMIEDRAREIEAYDTILSNIPSNQIVHIPSNVHAEGGDIILYDDILFLGISNDTTFLKYKMSRTNEAAYHFFKTQFPQKRVIPIQLNKHDTCPEKGTLHLDCAFQPIGKGKAIYYPEAFVHHEDVLLIESIFGTENLFRITSEEALNLATNVFSVSPKDIIIETKFRRLAQHLTETWHMKVYPIPYYEISKEGGLLRCSTCPLERIKS